MHRSTDLKLVTTVANGSHVNFFQLCNFFQKTMRFLAKFVQKYEIFLLIWLVNTHIFSKTIEFIQIHFTFNKKRTKILKYLLFYC